MLLAVGCASSIGSKSTELDRFMHLAPGTSVRLDPAIRGSLVAAMDDFHAVVAGRSPIHASPDANAFLPADGGTTFWSGDDYHLMIVKSFNTVGVDGDLYGPVLDLGPKLIVGNGPSISHVIFYPSQALRDLLGDQ
jgi:hypothetical protein